MTYSVAAHFDQPTWDKFGVNWLRKAKIERLKGLIIGHNLSDDTQEKISTMGFEFVPFSEKEDLVGRGNCLLTNFDCQPKGDLPKNKDIVCAVDKTVDKTIVFPPRSVMDLVLPIQSLVVRARMIKLIQDKVEKVYGGILSEKYILGSEEFWTKFFAFKKYIRAKRDYLDNTGMQTQLFLNLYVAFFNVEIAIND